MPDMNIFAHTLTNKGGLQGQNKTIQNKKTASQMG